MKSREKEGIRDFKIHDGRFWTIWATSTQLFYCTRALLKLKFISCFNYRRRPSIFKFKSFKVKRLQDSIICLDSVNIFTDKL